MYLSNHFEFFTPPPPPEMVYYDEFTTITEEFWEKLRRTHHIGKRIYFDIPFCEREWLQQSHHYHGENHVNVTQAGKTEHR